MGAIVGFDNRPSTVFFRVARGEACGNRHITGEPQGDRWRDRHPSFNEPEKIPAQPALAKAPGAIV